MRTSFRLAGDRESASRYSGRIVGADGDPLGGGAAGPGVSQAELVGRLDAVLPAGVEALTGAELTRELEEETQGEDHEAFQQALILFAGVALVVATFTIHNTFSILVAQRTRESALLRAFGASLKQSIDDAVDQQFTGDLVIIGEGAGGLSTDLALAVARLPEVTAASPRGGGPVRIDGESTLVLTFDPATIESVEHLEVRQGSRRDLRPNQVAISADYAEQRGLALGDPVTVDYPDGVTERPTVGAIYAEDNLSEGGGIRLPRDAYLPHTSRPADVNMLIALADGVSVAEAKRPSSGWPTGSAPPTCRPTRSSPSRSPARSTCTSPSSTCC